ncbi:hypothetical protein SAMN05518854_101842 [Variovorax sp. YR266]|nr:hypothetical protein SAMN05518854_101842 [Variovorax sp. YR266]
MPALGLSKAEKFRSLPALGAAVFVDAVFGAEGLGVELQMDTLRAIMIIGPGGRGPQVALIANRLMMSPYCFDSTRMRCANCAPEMPTTSVPMDVSLARVSGR